MTKELNLKHTGLPLKEAGKALIMLHGRGARAVDFITLWAHLEVSDCSVHALQAPQNTWYPYSFLAPVADNQPYLDNSLQYVDSLFQHIRNAGFESSGIFLMGFSQGACLALEYAARNAQRYGGIMAFTGALIGEKLDTFYYQGNFASTPVFIGSSDHDPHVPEFRIVESERILRNMGAEVTKKIYPGMGHTINQDEIEQARIILNGLAQIKD